MLRVVGVVQIVLGAAYLFAPGTFIEWMKLSPTPHDANYAYGMLASHSFAYGIGILLLSSPAFPMFNAALIAALLFLWRPKQVGSETK